MHSYPHVYRATALGARNGPVTVDSAGLPGLSTAAPPEFDGPGGVWSPETLLVGAIADCFILTFRGVARASGLAWETLDCTVEGTLERLDGVTRFSSFRTRATLTVGAGVEPAKARALLERAEKVCLVTNSLNGSRSIEVSVLTAT